MAQQHLACECSASESCTVIQPRPSEGEVPVELSAEEGLHGGRAVAAQRGLLPLGRQLVEGATELAVESRQIEVVLM